MYNGRTESEYGLHMQRSQREQKVDAISKRIGAILQSLDTTPTLHNNHSNLPVLKPFKESEQALMHEIQRIQEVVTDLISLFQDYRSTIDDQLEQLSSQVASIDEKVKQQVESGIARVKKEIISDISEYVESTFTRQEELIRRSLQEFKDDQISAIQEELTMIREAEIQIIEKINAISTVNAQCHQTSAIAIKSIRDVLINQSNRYSLNFIVFTPKLCFNQK